MNGIESARVECPACGELIELLIDCSVGEQEYLEDCEVCCRPMRVVAKVDARGQADVSVFA